MRGVIALLIVVSSLFIFSLVFVSYIANNDSSSMLTGRVTEEQEMCEELCLSYGFADDLDSCMNSCVSCLNNKGTWDFNEKESVFVCNGATTTTTPPTTTTTTNQITNANFNSLSGWTSQGTPSAPYVTSSYTANALVKPYNGNFLVLPYTSLNTIKPSVKQTVSLSSSGKYKLCGYGSNLGGASRGNICINSKCTTTTSSSSNAGQWIKYCVEETLSTTSLEVSLSSYDKTHYYAWDELTLEKVETVTPPVTLPIVSINEIQLTKKTTDSVAISFSSSNAQMFEAVVADGKGNELCRISQYEELKNYLEAKNQYSFHCSWTNKPAGDYGITIVVVNDLNADGDYTDSGEYASDWQGNAIKVESLPAICGNKIVEGIEECDDGNTAKGDGCSDICEIEWSKFVTDIQTDKAWDITEGSEEVVIAVLDIGMVYKAATLAGCDWEPNNPSFDFDKCLDPNFFWRNEGEIVGDGIDNDGNGYVDDIIGWDFYFENNNPTDYYPPSDYREHGDQVVSVLKHKLAYDPFDKRYVQGICPNCKIMLAKIEHGQYHGEGVLLTTQKIVDAVNYAVDNGADIILITQVAEIDYGLNSKFISPLLEKTFNNAYDKGILIVGSAGNENIEPALYPAFYSSVMGVGSTFLNPDKRAWFSNYGEGVEISALGRTSIPRFILDEVRIFPYTELVTGTSFSAPLVAGTAGLMLSVNPDLEGQEIRQILIDTADPIVTDKPIGGRVNVYKAVLAAKESANQKQASQSAEQSNDFAINSDSENNYNNELQDSNLENTSPETTTEEKEILGIDAITLYCYMAHPFSQEKRDECIASLTK